MNKMNWYDTVFEAFIKVKKKSNLIVSSFAGIYLVSSLLWSLAFWLPLYSPFLDLNSNHYLPYLL